MCDEYGLLRLDNDHSFLPLFAVQTSVIGFDCEELFPAYVEAFRLYLFDVAGVGERGNDGFDLGGRDLQYVLLSMRQVDSTLSEFADL